VGPSSEQSYAEYAPWNARQAVEFGVEIGVVRGLSLTPLREQKTRHHREVTREAADEGFVIGDFPPNPVEPHFCHPTLDFSAPVRLLPVEAPAASHGPGHVATVRHVNHRAPSARLIGHQVEVQNGVSHSLFEHR